MTVRDLLDLGPDDVEVRGLAFDHRRVSPGTLFFCVPGFTRDGHDFAADAVEHGAAALVVQRPLGSEVPEVLVDDVRATMARAAARFYREPSVEELAVVGVTGTNGKTTTAFILADLLEASDVQCGLLGTVKAVVGGQDVPTIRTTPEAIELQRTLRAMVDGRDKACAMEVSSHALAMHRADHVQFAAVIFTNLTQDHLDFHSDMEEYFQAKRLLFERPNSEGNRQPVRIINIDDSYGRRLAADFPDAITFGFAEEADYQARDLKIQHDRCRFALRTPEGKWNISLPLPGEFNVLNLLGAWIAASRGLNVPEGVLARAVPAVSPVPGRFQPVDEGQGFAVLVDYAHTPDSLESVLRTARGVTDGRVIVVFGAGGDRDKAKRPLMGAIASELADLCIVTSDNPRSEKPESILADILTGVQGEVETEVDRQVAIHKAVEMALPGDVVVIAGKGHELGQEFADGHRQPFDDVIVAREALRSVRGTT